MTNTQTQPTNERPSDEVTAKVVAKWKGYEYGRYNEQKDGWYPNKGFKGDPLLDSEAASKLLWWLKMNRHSVTFAEDGYQYRSGNYRCPFGTHEDDCLIPFSFPEFRYAVVRLAAQCLGVEGC